MKYYIYLDVYFGFNFFMDFFLILILHQWNRCCRSRWFCALAGMLGAVYAVLVVVKPFPKILGWILTYLGMGPLLSLVALDFRGIKALGNYLMQLYLVAFFLSGTLTVGGELFCQKQNLYRFTGIAANVDARFCIAMAFFSYVIFSAMYQRLRQNVKVQQKIVNVKISVEGKTVKIRGLCDTGNLLVEPMTGKPACVIEEAVARKLKGKEHRPVFIPYNSIDCQNGIMEGFWSDYIYVNQKIYPKVPIGIRKKVSGKNQYEIILPPEIFEGKGSVDGNKPSAKKE